ncbi:unnamed protein product [Cyprideis torosa]|uniref:Uncharacterized protein n=1 Tax=Cyprideis torosa TaxID=163714 RepID=A0A7R8WJK2_9CRUS|nr:unnamed protein product [Cyprideis torosa]CAG0895833.1 unnamed protein product [Cyprideis torosa]
MSSETTLAEEEALPTELESLCMSCGENGTTRMILTRIPFYKDVLVMSFHCEHCGMRNNELQAAGRVEDFGIAFNLEVKTSEDLNRTVVKSDHAKIQIPKLDFEIPSRSQKGEVTTVEGVLRRASEGLLQEQNMRREIDPENAKKIDDFLERLQELLNVNESFHFILEDISGSSYISNPLAPQNDPQLKVRRFNRTSDQDHVLGVYSRFEVTGEQGDQLIPEGGVEKEEVMEFPTNCPSCNSPCRTRMKVVDIPYFKEVVIMCTVCDSCNTRTNEVKSGGPIEKKGKKHTLILQPDPTTICQDMSRDVLKSATCEVSIPELDMSVGSGALGGRFTTVEGLLEAMKNQLIESGAGDSAPDEARTRLKEFGAKLDSVISGDFGTAVTLILDDPAGNSYVQDLYAPEKDPRLTIEDYERTFEQNEELGLNDMKTENYQEETTGESSQ